MAEETKKEYPPVMCSIGARMMVDIAKLRGDISAELNSHTEILKGMKAMQEVMNDRIEKMLDKYDKRIGDTERKIEEMNNKIIKASGMATGISLALSSIAMYIKSFFTLGGHN